ncbi:MAG TPA: alpha/beta fold hydrolase [Bordetella sp.]
MLVNDPGAAPQRDEKPIRLRRMRSFFVGGGLRRVAGQPVQSFRLTQGGAPRAIDVNGDHITGQMYVQEYLLEEPRHPWPILLWHGGGMSGVNWETTPDGRPGWLNYFLHAGFDVYVSDAMERGRSSWSPTYPLPPIFRTLKDGWDIFRMGPVEGYATDPASRKPFPGQQFPMEAYDTFATQWVPRWAEHEAETSAAYDALLEAVGRCVVIGHSQGGGFAFEAIRRRPRDVAAVVLLEPSGAPQKTEGMDAGLPPHLVVWGDFFAEHAGWRANRAVVDRYGQALREHGVEVDQLDLPAMGIHGNSHFPMMDRNAGDIAALVERWIVQHARRP